MRHSERLLRSPVLDIHNPTQRFYFDDNGPLRRLDYQPEVLGKLGAPGVPLVGPIRSAA